MCFVPKDWVAGLMSAILTLVFVSPTYAGGWARRRSVQVRPTTTIVETVETTSSPEILGTFYPSRYMTVRSDGPTGAGYAPLGQYGLGSLAIDGPFSPYRSVSAPVRVYSRGYDGNVILSEGTSFSTPFRPESSPVIYPTPNAYFGRPRGAQPTSRQPNAINWIDQN